MASVVDSGLGPIPSYLLTYTHDPGTRASFSLKMIPCKNSDVFYVFECYTVYTVIHISLYVLCIIMK